MAARELRRNGTDEASRPSLDWSTRLAVAYWGQESRRWKTVSLTFSRQWGHEEVSDRLIQWRVWLRGTWLVRNWIRRLA